MRTPIIAGNWKMYKTVADTVKYVKEFRGMVKTSPTWRS
jgi:triosephosphate isomerase